MLVFSELAEGKWELACDCDPGNVCPEVGLDGDGLGLNSAEHPNVEAL